MVKGVLIRIQSDDSQTLGHLRLFNGTSPIFGCVTLELPNKQNRNQVSRIPQGHYHVKSHTSPSQGLCYSLLDVPSRSNILIHKGNYYTDILGCILVGTAFSDINNDGRMDITSSGATLNNMLSIVKEFWLWIIDYDEQINS